MTYLLLLLSLVLNGVLVWYVRKMLGKLEYEIDVRVAFKEMLQDYAASLENLYKLEELYGEEIIKRAIIETNFVIEACTEFKKAIEVSQAQDEEATEDEEDDAEEDDTSGQASSRQTKESIIRLREGEKVSQDASSYRRVRPTDFSI
jgi:hypothetical protein